MEYFEEVNFCKAIQEPCPVYTLCGICPNARHYLAEFAREMQLSATIGQDDRYPTNTAVAQFPDGKILASITFGEPKIHTGLDELVHRQQNDTSQKINIRPL